MFEKFTEKAINVVTEAQHQAYLMKNAYVQPEHLLIAIMEQAKGVSLKLFRMYGITVESVKESVEGKLRFEKSDREVANIPFSTEFKNLLKETLDLASKTGNSYILFEHLFIAVISDKMSYCPRILEGFKFDINNATNILYKMVQKKNKKKLHPEIDDVKEEIQVFNPDAFFEEENSSKILKQACEYLSQSNNEMIGTEHIISAILKTGDEKTLQILNENGIQLDKFIEKTNELNSRELEFDNKLIFTPCAKQVIDTAFQLAKELGYPTLRAEHFILSLLNLKKGVAYETFKALNVNSSKLEEEIMKPIEYQMPQALTILRLAKQEARRLGRNVVGTEMILLGIISEGTGIGYKVLHDLEISLKDLREYIEKLIGYGNEYYENDIIYTRRAKRVLEIAWQKAKKYNRPRIMSEHLLYAVTTEPSSVAMIALEHLGVDAVEIRQGIMKEIEA